MVISAEQFTKRECSLTNIKNCRSAANWDNYRKQRNNVTKLKKIVYESIFFMNDMQEDRSRRTFGPPSNPYYLRSLDKIASDQPEVCELFNDHFVNVGKDIDKSSDHYKDDFSNHPSLTKILEILPSVSLIRNLLLSQCS